jgi:hypothetical protein
MHALKYLVGYPPHVLERVRVLIEQGRLGAMLDEKYGEGHVVRSNGPKQKGVRGNFAGAAYSSSLGSRPDVRSSACLRSDDTAIFPWRRGV